MAVLWCREKYGNEAEFDAKGDGSKYRRIFFAYTDDPQRDREETIWQSNAVQSKVRLLRPWEAGHDLDPSSFAMRVRVKSLEELPELYEIEVEYEPPGVEEVGGNESENPFDEPPEIEYTWASYKRALWIWYSRAPNSENPSLWELEEQRWRLGVLNSAKEPLDPQPEIDDDRLVLTITRNEPTFSASLAMIYANTTNSDPYSGAYPGQLLMKPWRARRLHKKNIFYWAVTYEIHFRKEGWNLKLVDYGSYYWEGGYEAGGPKPVYFKDKGDNPTTGLLAANGDKLAPGAKPLIIGGDEGMAVYGQARFSLLNLPIPP